MTQANIAPRPLTGVDDPEVTLADVLAHLRGEIGETLIDADAAAQLARIAQAVPAALAPFWGVEIRLADPTPRADILWEVRRESRGSALLAGTAEGEDRLASLCARSPVWQAMRRFAELWGTEGVGAHVGNLWFEADAAAARTDAELDVALTRPCLFWGARTDRNGSDRALLAALPTLAHDVFGLSLTSAPLHAAARALPEGAEIFQIGVMGARAGTLTRLCLRRMEQGEAMQWLKAIGWPGDPAAAFARLAPYLSAAHAFALNVDLLDGRTGPKLGVELYREPGHIDLARWRDILTALEADGLALPAKTAAILRYPGKERFDQSHEWHRRTGWGYPTLSRSLHHVKVVVTPDGVEEAKSYLGAYRPSFDYGAVFGAPEKGDRDAWLEP